MTYYVIEFQTGDTGAAIPLAYTDRNLALQKFHEIMAYASVSSVPKHGAIIITEDLFVLESGLGYRNGNNAPIEE